MKSSPSSLGGIKIHFYGKRWKENTHGSITQNPIKEGIFSNQAVTNVDIHLEIGQIL